MAFIVQTDSGTVSNANSYITVDEFKNYHKDRGNEITVGTGDIQKAIVKATDYLDTRFRYVGERLNRPQATEWPRLNAFDIDETLINGIPIEVKEATAEYGLQALNGDLYITPTQEATGQTLRREENQVTVDGVKRAKEFFRGANTGFHLPKVPVADQKLRARGLIRVGGKLVLS